MTALNPICVERKPLVSLVKGAPRPVMVPLQIVVSARDEDGWVTGQQLVGLTYMTGADLADLHVQIEKRRGELAWLEFEAERARWAASSAAIEADRRYEEAHLSEVRELVEAGMRATAEKEAAAAERERA